MASGAYLEEHNRVAMLTKLKNQQGENRNTDETMRVLEDAHNDQNEAIGKKMRDHLLDKDVVIRFNEDVKHIQDNNKMEKKLREEMKLTKRNKGKVQFKGEETNKDDSQFDRILDKNNVEMENN